MTSVLGLGLGFRLAWGSRAQRIRSVAVAVASALGAASLLLVWAVARDRVLGADAFQQEAGYVVLGTVLMVALPVVAMVATVAKLQTRTRETRLANLRRLGLSAAQTRWVAGVEVGVASVTGVLLAIPLHLALGGLVQQVDVVGQPWNPYLFSVPWYGWPCVLVGVPAVAVLVAVWPPGESTAQGTVSPDVERSGWWRLLPLLAGLLTCGWAVQHHFGGFISDRVAYAVLAGVALAGVGLLLAAPVLVRLVADLGVRLARGPVTTIAARRLQSSPGTVLRVVATLMAVLVVLAGAQGALAAFEDVPQYREGERAVTEGQTAEVSVAAAEVSDTVARLEGSSGVDRVVDLPVALVTVEGQDPTEEALLATVATCADLAAVGADVPGCVDGRVLVGDWRADLLAAQSGAVSPLRMEEGGVTDSSTRVDLSAAVTVPGGGLQDWRLAGGMSLVIPPDAPGITDVVAVTGHRLIVLGPAGRDLMTTMDGAGVDSYATFDSQDYDFTQGMHVVIRVVAALLLLLGLLTMAVALVDRAVARRHEIASLRALGTSPGVLRRAQFLEAVVPVLLGTVSAVLVGWMTGNAYLVLAETDPVPVPWALVAGSVVASFVVAGLTVLGIGSDARSGAVRRV